MTSSFTFQMEDWVSDTEKALDGAVRELGIELFRRVILRSPVGNEDFWKVPIAPKGYVGGRFRGNWQVAIGEVPRNTLQLVDPGGVATMSKGAAKFLNLKVGQVIHLINNLPYSIRLEDGWSRRQAPQGIVNQVMLEVPKMTRAAARRHEVR